MVNSKVEFSSHPIWCSFCHFSGWVGTVFKRTTRRSGHKDVCGTTTDFVRRAKQGRSGYARGAKVKDIRWDTMSLIEQTFVILRQVVEGSFGWMHPREHKRPRNRTCVASTWMMILAWTDVQQGIWVTKGGELSVPPYFVRGNKTKNISDGPIAFLLHDWRFVVVAIPHRLMSLRCGVAPN